MHQNTVVMLILLVFPATRTECRHSFYSQFSKCPEFFLNVTQPVISKPFGLLCVGEEAEVPPVHPSRPEGRQRAPAPDGLVLREAPPSAAALFAAADPQPATAALQLPHHPARPSQVSVKHDCVCGSRDD